MHKLISFSIGYIFSSSCCPFEMILVVDCTFQTNVRKFFNRNLYLSSLSFLQGHQYKTVSGFVCEVFGYIPRTVETIKVILEKETLEDEDVHTEGKFDIQEVKEKHQIYKLEVEFGFHAACLFRGSSNA